MITRIANFIIFDMEKQKKAEKREKKWKKGQNNG
jgi:hypothetical protein